MQESYNFENLLWEHFAPRLSWAICGEKDSGIKNLFTESLACSYVKESAIKYVHEMNSRRAKILKIYCVSVLLQTLLGCLYQQALSPFSEERDIYVITCIIFPFHKWTSIDSFSLSSMHGDLYNLNWQDCLGNWEMIDVHPFLECIWRLWFPSSLTSLAPLHLCCSLVTGNLCVLEDCNHGRLTARAVRDFPVLQPPLMHLFYSDLARTPSK